MIEIAVHVGNRPDEVADVIISTAKPWLNMIQVIRFLAVVSMLTALAGQAIGGHRAAGKVESCTFPTRSLPPPFRVPTEFADGYKLFQAAATSCPREIW